MPRRPIVVVSICALAWGCGAGADGPGTVPRSALDAQDRELVALRARAETQEERIRELEGMLALSRAEVRDLRSAEAREPAPPVAAVRIGAEVAEPEPLPEWDEPSPSDDGPRPILRLYGTPVREPDPIPLVVPEAPPGVPDRLSVAPLPGESAVPPPVLGTPAVPSVTEAVAPDPVESAYRDALTLVRDRAFARAEAALTSVIDAHPRHVRAVDALYWRGVVRYASRSYSRAIADFTAVVARHPRSERAPEALLKMAICHERMGDARRARSLYERVRSEYPNSVAARVASQEDAT